MGSIFSKIISGEIPSHKVHEDERTFAFMDINPITKGHVLVVSKVEVDRFEDLGQEDYQALWETVRQVAHRIRETYNPTRVCIKVEGFDVPHAHVHVFGCQDVEEFYNREHLAKEPDHRQLAVEAKKLAF